MSATTIQNQEVQVSQVSQVETVTENTNQVESETNGRGGSRSFKVKLEAGGQLYGRYNGESPYQAANKALSEIVRTREKSGNMDDGEISFFLVESTKNSSKKQHQYVGRRIKLDVPIEYPVANGITIKKEHKNFLRKVKRTGSQVANTGTETNTPTATATATATANTTTTLEPTVVSSENTTAGSTVNILV
jgi:hypothetical protein